MKYNIKSKKVENNILNKIRKIVKDEKKIWSYDFIKYNYLNNLSYLYPSKSLIKNIGFDGSGINSKIDSYIIKNSKYIDLQRKSLINKIRYFY